MLRNGAVCIHTGNAVRQISVNTLNRLFFCVGQFFIFFRQIKFHTGRHHHIKNSNGTAKRLVVCVDIVRIHLSNRLIAAEQRHTHSFVNKDSAFVHANVILFLCRRRRAAVGIALLRLGRTLALRGFWLGKVHLRLGNRFVRRFHRRVCAAQNPDIIVANSQAFLCSIGKGHQKIPHRESIGIVSVKLLGETPVKPVLPADLRFFRQISLLHFRYIRLF